MPQKTVEHHPLQRVVKRSVDLLLAVPAIVMLAPIMFIVAVGSRLNMGKPVLFRQIRPGWNGTPFTLLKFRTMSQERDALGNLLSDSKRLTKYGAFLRRTSLDELPQLWNVVAGDLSLVGPRPLLMEYLERYTPDQARRHEVMPGITGWAQINGRNALDWDQKFALDTWYVDNWSLWLDCKILCKTLIQVFSRKGISLPGHVTMPVFKGTESGGSSR